MRLATLAAVSAAAVALAGCSAGGGEDPKLMQFKNDGRPDELATVAAKPLVFPDPATRLQPPAPGGFNRADRRPGDEVIASMGGKRAAERDASASGSRNLLAYSTRFGSDPLIRQTLEAEDLAFRRRNDGLFLERVFKVSRYFDVYRPMSIDPYAELRRLRRSNVRTPPAPPPGRAPQ